MGFDFALALICLASNCIELIGGCHVPLLLGGMTEVPLFTYTQMSPVMWDWMRTATSLSEHGYKANN
jgi:hypothetical protein